MNSNDLLYNYPKNFEPGTSLANVIGEQIIQPISSILSNTESNNDSENDLENIKYKTELCRNYSTYGFCSYSSRCQFAHGLEELRCRTRHPKYKTEFCRNFLSGFCKYGSRCQFLHHTNESNDTLTTPYSTAVAAIGTYLLTNMLTQSTAFNFEGTALAALAAYANIPSKQDSSLKRTCGIEMQHLHLTPRISIAQNQNNNDLQLITSAIHCQSSEKLNMDTKRIRKSSAHI